MDEYLLVVDAFEPKKLGLSASCEALAPSTQNSPFYGFLE